jgi:hypothetical protein
MTTNLTAQATARPEVLATREIVKRMTMDEKIKFWRDVMSLKIVRR